MLQTSSKRLQKIKKKLKKQDTTDYQFLLQSLQRQNNKENYPSNINQPNRSSINDSTVLSKTSMINSIQMSKNTQTNSNLNNNYCKIRLVNNNNHGQFFEPTKNLINNSIDFDQNKDKANYLKNSSKMSKVKWIDSQKIDKTNKLKEINIDDFQSKLQAYVEFVHQIFEQALNQKGMRQSKVGRKKCLLQSLGKDLIEQSKKHSNERAKSTTESIQVSHFSTYNSRNVSRQISLGKMTQSKEQMPMNYKKIIDSLSNENNKLEQLISEHQRKNIKMFIQMNQNQSKQIQKCKQYLSKLYDKYKILEKMIIKENQKYRKAKQEIKNYETKNKELQNRNYQLTNLVESMKLLIQQNRNNTSSKLSFEQDSTQTIFIFNHKKQNQKKKYDESNIYEKNFITKREKISSNKQNELQSQLKMKKKNSNDEDFMSCSTLTKGKGIKKKKEKVPKLNINLKEQLNEQKQDEKLRNNLQNVKNELNNQISQKTALKSQIEALYQKLNKKDEKFGRMQNLIKDQLNQIQKLISRNNYLTSELKKFQNKTHITNYQSNKMISQLLQLSQIQKKPSQIDEYRIIAIQASAIQNLLQ